MIPRYAFSLALLLCLGACTLGPDHAPPELELPGQWSDASNSDEATDLVRWWTRFDDPELERLVRRALEGSLDLEATRERLLAARARRGVQHASRLPTLDADASYERIETGDDAVTFGAPSGSSTDLYALGVVAGWELDLWGRVDRLVEAADAEIDIAIEDHRAARLALVAEVARLVVTIRSIDAERTIVEQTIETDRERFEILDAQARVGLSDALARSRAERQIRATSARLPALDADRRASELGLAMLLDVAPDEVRVSERPMPHADVLPALGVPADLLMRRPDLRRAERHLAATTARIGATRAEAWPRVTLSGSIALQGPDLGDVVNPDAHVLRFGPAITLPLFEGGRIRSRIEIAESERRSAMITLRDLALDAIVEVETAALRRERTAERASILADAERAALDTETLAIDRYRAGVVDLLDVTEARNQRLTIAIDRIRAERDERLRLIELYAALGGGWDDTTPLARGTLDR